MGVSDAIKLLQVLQRSEKVGTHSSLGKSNSSETRQEPSFFTFHEKWRRELQGKSGILEASQILRLDLPTPDWAGYSAATADAEHASDGLLYSLAKIEQADMVAESFHAVWTSMLNLDEADSIPEVETVKNLAKICLVLKTIDQGDDFLTNFCEYHLAKGHDLKLPLQQDVLSEVLPARPGIARLFEAEQYRVVRRDYLREWSLAKKPVKLVRGEPIPFLSSRHCPHGSFAAVTICRHVDDQQKCYAIKKAHDRRFNGHVKSELEVLGRIEAHNHVIRLVFALERLGCLMLVLEPAASEDLCSFLGSYRENLKNPSRGVDLRHERKVLGTAFGCLSHGLRHLHKNLRHKDIKLDNILYVKKNDGGARLLLTDFGIAHYYGSGNPSDTYNDWHFAKKFTAPEVLEDDAEYMKQHRSHQNSSEEGLARLHISHLHSAGHFTKGHDTKSDIFSLGACFLEILSALVQEPLSQTTGVPEKDFLFAEHVETLLSWAQNHADCQPASELKAAFQVAHGMIQYDKNDRWELDQVIRHLATPDVGDQMFCTEFCRQEALSLADTPLNKVEEDKNQVQRAINAIEEEDNQNATLAPRRGSYTSSGEPQSGSNGNSNSAPEPPSQRDGNQPLHGQSIIALRAGEHNPFAKARSNAKGSFPEHILKRKTHSW